MANTTLSHQPALMSFRSSVDAAGSTISAKRATGVQKTSCTTIVSGFRQPRRSLLMSWWWWNGLPPPHMTIWISG